MFDRGTPEYWNARKDAFRIVQALERPSLFRTLAHDVAAADPMTCEILHAQGRDALLHPALTVQEAIKQLADNAAAGCGQSHDIYVQRFSASFERWLPNLSPSIRDHALKIAQEFDYCSPDEINASFDDMIAERYCVHGLDESTCPCGCFEY